MLDLFSATVVLIRLFALYMLINATFAIPAALSFIRQTAEYGQWFGLDTIILGVTGIVYITIALLLLFYSKRFAQFVVRDLENGKIDLVEDNYKILQAIGFSILGAYVLTYAIPNLAKIITIYVASESNTMNYRSPFDDDLSYPTVQRKVPLEYLIEVISQLALGVLLIIGSKGLMKVLRKGWDSIKLE